MTIDVSSAGVMISAIFAIAGLLGWIWAFSARLARMDIKIDTLWDFQLRRGVVEAIEHGLAIKNSPVVVTEDAKARIRELGIQLKAIFVNLGPSVKDRDLAIAIERYLGDELVDKLCLPVGVSQGACLIVAMAVAKGE